MDNDIIRNQKEIAGLKDTIKDLNDKLKESEALKSNFISNIMNEVYNPFSSILSMAENIISLKEDNLETAKHMAGIIYQEAAQLDFHLQNIFTAATIEAGLESLNLSKVDIEKIVSNILSKLRYHIDSKDINIVSKFDITDNPTLISDVKKLSLILLNIISNSIKNSPEDSEILCSYNQIGSNLNIVIQDSGTGISDSELNNIFDRFKRIDETINSVTGGTGLGLSVVKALTEILGGNINIISEGGTKVMLSIPCDHKVDSGESFEDGALFFDEEVF